MNIQGKWICDDEGRRLLLRGCNLGGSNKVPRETDGGISFAGKPFPLEDADERFASLARWGLRFNRLVVPWEAIEHEGPGIYDEVYLAYLRKLLLAAEKYELLLWIDPHQDVWGRAAGGDGAPAWTLECLGINTETLEAAGAVLPRSVNDTVPPEYRPLMTWPAGNNRYAAATMFTLFFAGGAFAPDLRVKNSGGTENIQDFLQNHYIEAFAHARRRLKNCRAIAGWGTMNEPHPGFIGYKNLAALENNIVAVGPMPSPFAAMAAASGHTVEIPVYSTGIFGVERKGTAVLNSDGVSIFREGFSCPWKAAGIWDDSGGRPQLLKPDHFALYGGKPFRFARDFLSPFISRFTGRLGEADEKTFFFIEGVPAGIATGEDAGNAVNTVNAGPAGRTKMINAFHWYDGPTMFLKQFRPWFNFDTKTGRPVLGEKAVARLYRRQMALHISKDMPDLVGEFGIPFDLFRGRAFKTGDYSVHEKALEMYYDAIDGFLLGACIWDYSADNTFRWGDSWNNEDFSIVTLDGDGGRLRPRAESGWLRPYPLATAGLPLFFKWDRKRKRLRYCYETDSGIAAPTAIFIPETVWSEKPSVTVPEGILAEYRPEKQLLLVYHNGFEGEVELTVG